MTQGERLKAWRQKNGLSQRAAAEKLSTAQKTWAQWEAGTLPEVDYIDALERLTKGAITVKGYAKERRATRAAAADSGTDVAAPVAKSA